MKNVGEILSTMPVLNKQQGKRSEPTQEQKERVQAVINKLFIQLKAACPAMFHTLNQAEESEVKRQWVIGFIENKMTPRLIDSGMMIARRQTNPYLPSVGQFLKWCKIGTCEQYDLPTQGDLMLLLKKYSASLGLDSHVKFNYGSNANYWLVTELYQAVKYGELSESQAQAKASELINKLMDRMATGFIPPEPQILIEAKTTYTPSANPLEHIQKIKQQLGLIA